MTSYAEEDLRALLVNLLAGIAGELAEIRRKGGTVYVTAKSGRREKDTPEGVVYRFQLSGLTRFKEGALIRVDCTSGSAGGVVLSIREDSVQVLLDADIGEAPTRISLISDEAFLLERLREELEAIMEKESEREFNPLAAMQVFGMAPVRIACETSDGVAGLNGNQAVAVAKGLANEVTYIWGPPGTGKTTTTAALIEEAYRVGDSVLLVSNTNLAVDALLAKVCERLSSHPGLDAGEILRFGPAVNEGLERDFGDRVLAENAARRSAPGLFSRKDSLDRTAEEALVEITRIEGGHRELRELRRAQLALKGKQNRQGRLEAEYLAARAAEGRGGEGVLPEGIGERSLQDIENELSRLRAEVETAENEVMAYRTVIEIDPDLEKLELRLQELREASETAERELKVVDSQIEGTKKRLAEKCRIAATTAYQTYLRKSWNPTYDLVVIDEASMLPLPLIFFVSGLARKAVVVAGDFRQLPVVQVSRDPLATQWFGRDIFHAAGIVEVFEKGKTVPQLAMLDAQYRMDQEICRLINRPFYGGLLKSPMGRMKTTIGFPAPVMVLDTSSLEPWCGQKRGSGSRYNVVHAAVITALLRSLQRRGRMDEDLSEVGIIAPYQAQTQMINAMLDEAGLAKAASTVHRYQGSECNTILFDLTDSLGVSLGGFLRPFGEEGDLDKRLLNVAISRARQHVVLVGNMDYLRERAVAGSALEQVLGLAEEGGKTIDAARIVGSGLCRTEAWDEIAVASRAARRRIDLYSPLLSLDALQHLLGPFTEAAGRGVQVHLHTHRPAAGQMDDLQWGHGEVEEAEELRRVLRDMAGEGIVFPGGGRVRERFALIDGTRIWTGWSCLLGGVSGPILSLKSTGLGHQLARMVAE